MEPESEIDAVLIDAFDAEPAPVYAAAPLPPYRPMSGATYSSAIQTSGRMDAPTTSAPVGALRHYPSLDSLASPSRATRNTTSHQTPLSSLSHTTVPAPTPILYPRWPTDKTDVAPKTHEESGRQITQTSSKDRDRTLPQYDQHHDPEQYSHVAYLDRQAVQPSVQTPQEYEPLAQVRSHSYQEPRTVPTPTDEEIARQQRLLRAEIHRFEQQADYMALALAGETPHQIEQRRQREEERKEREQRRLAAMETRALNTIEREQQRQARQEERRMRHTERTHQSSRSPLPERSDEAERDDDGDQHRTDTQVSSDA